MTLREKLFCFQPYGLSDIELSIDELAQGPRYKTNFVTGDVAHAYRGFVETAGLTSGTSLCGITLAEWKTKKTFMDST